MTTIKTNAPSEIDKALNEAKARKAAKQGSSEADAGSKKRLTDEEKAAKKAEKDAEQARRKQERDAARAAKKAERVASRPQAHTAKVEKARARLPKLDNAAQAIYSDVVSNFTSGQVAALAAHLEFHNREQATVRALSVTFNEGDRVRIVGGNARFIGQTGTVSKPQRIRMYVELDGSNKRAYMFTSDAELVEAASRTGTTG